MNTFDERELVDLALQELLNTPPWEWPAHADDTIVRVLRDREAATTDRLAAAGLATDLAILDDQIAAVLLSIAGDAGEPERLRASAAISLGPALEEADFDGANTPCGKTSIALMTVQRFQKTFREIYSDGRLSNELRRKALEASVRAPQLWHRDPILAANASADPDWKLTAVFCMRYIPGFDAQILDALKSANPDIRVEAVRSAGVRELDGAWPHVSALMDSEETERPLLLAAIEAAAVIRPREARGRLEELSASEDAEIAEAARDALEEASFATGEDEDFLF